MLQPEALTSDRKTLTKASSVPVRIKNHNAEQIQQVQQPIATPCLQLGSHSGPQLSLTCEALSTPDTPTRSPVPHTLH